MTLGRRRKQRHGNARSQDVTTTNSSDDVQWQLTSGGGGSVAHSQPDTPPPSSKMATAPSSGLTAGGNSGQSNYYTHSLIARQPLSLQCLKYDSGFGSTFSSSVNSSIAATGSTSSANALPLVAALPPPPPYRRVSLPSTRPLRIHRSYSDSKHRSCRRLDNFHCVSPWCSWSTATSRSPSPSMTTVSCPEYGDLQDKLQRLESDRESLSLQVSVLAEQVGAQTDKIRDLESMLEDKKTKLDSTEEMLHEELVTRSSLETNKLDLMAEISNLKLKMAALERDKYEREQQLKTAQSEISQLQSVLKTRGDDQDDLRFPSGAFDRSSELSRLRHAVQKLITNNAEKEEEIVHLRKYIDGDPTQGPRFRGLAVDFGCSTAPRSFASGMAPEYYNSHAVDPSVHMRKLLTAAEISHYGVQDGQFMDEYYRSGSTSLHAATCGSDFLGGPVLPRQLSSSTSCYPSSPLSGRMRSPRYAAGLGAQSSSVMSNRFYGNSASRQLAAELDQLALHYRRPIMEGYYPTGSLPRQIALGAPRKCQNGDYGEWSPNGCFTLLCGNYQSLPLQRGIQGDRRSTSVPNLGLAPIEEDKLFPATDSDDVSVRSASQFNDHQFKRNRKYSSLRNFVSRIKRSTSEEGRIGNGHHKSSRQYSGGSVVDRPGQLPLFDLGCDRRVFIRPALSVFCKWNSDQLSEWLCELGLSSYVTDCRHNVKSGRHMINMTDADFEKYLCIKDPLHRKRLRIALMSIEAGKQEPPERMDYQQTVRWLDDIGLPQYREAFIAYRVDGSMLDVLTVDDLFHLRITCALHHASIRRGIQILRMVGFNPGRLHRKFDPLVTSRGSCASAVQWWTQHCVSEWLRTNDLTEFTPNLMCSGVHGGLLILEPTFTAESLASVLQIGAQKTLLRRHVSTQFSNLIGTDLVAAKRQFLVQSNSPVLTPVLKVKLQKKSGFSLTKKKGKNEIFCEAGELVCPVIKRSTTSVPLKAPIRPVIDGEAARNGGTQDSLANQVLHNMTTTNV
uniref:SAM domain-containing protein n=1 Tax=Trichuris muris TaxID=70415 RepID=A0A5S6QIH7_TRIMR